MDSNATSSETIQTNTKTYKGNEYTIITEGKADILYPIHNQVFYNPVQQFNRDLSILSIKLFIDDYKKKFKHPIKLVEALSASGLRSIRYMKEIEGIDHIIANDIDKKAVEIIERNIEYNGLTKEQISTTNEDARFLLYSLANQSNKTHEVINIIDLDPYGSAGLFLDGAVEAISNGGLLCITCTDLAVLCGNYPEACFAKYGAMTPKNTDYCHEMAIRIMLGTLSQRAALHRKKIVPLLSFYADFYVRAFVKIENTKGDIKLIPSHNGFIFQCTQCNSFHIQRFGKVVENKNNLKTTLADAPVIDKQCDQCFSSFKIGGPVWLEPTFDTEFVNRAIEELEKEGASELYGTHTRLITVLNNIKQELRDVPLFYDLPDMCNTLRITTPTLNMVRSALVHQGYRVSLSHTGPNTIKTDAPNHVLWDILRCWNKKAPRNLDKVPKDSASYKILSVEPKIEANFELIEEVCIQKRVNGKKIKRYMPNPEKYWGPGTKAGKKREYGSMKDILQNRRAENQGKLKKKRTKDNTDNSEMSIENEQDNMK